MIRHFCGRRASALVPLFFSLLTSITTIAIPFTPSHADIPDSIPFSSRDLPDLTSVSKRLELSLEFPFIPHRSLTTGSICDESDPDFVRYRYDEQIAYCKRNVKKDQKTEIYRLYQVPSHCRSEYTIDHFIPLSIGGTNHPDNLWPEHKSIKRLRRNLELDLYKLMEQGRITQADAIHRIREAKWNPPVHDPGQFSFCQ